MPPAAPFLVPSRNGGKKRPGGRFRFLPPGGHIFAIFFDNEFGERGLAPLESPLRLSAGAIEPGAGYAGTPRLPSGGSWLRRRRRLREYGDRFDSALHRLLCEQDICAVRQGDGSLSDRRQRTVPLSDRMADVRHRPALRLSSGVQAEGQQDAEHPQDDQHRPQATSHRASPGSRIPAGSGSGPPR